jgi:hypothetical protein
MRRDPMAIRLAKQITDSVIKDVPNVVPAVVVVAHHWAAVATFEALKTYKGRLVHLPEVDEVPNAIEDETTIQFNLVRRSGPQNGQTILRFTDIFDSEYKNNGCTCTCTREN